MHKLRNILAPLRVLDAVYRSGGVGRAADRLHITPGAVSHQLRKLESELGMTVVQRVGRDICFTAVGQELAIRCAELFDRLESVVDVATRSEDKRAIRVKLIPSVAIKWLMPRLPNFYARHHDVDIEIATVSRVDDTYLDNADFVVRRGSGTWPGLSSKLLFKDKLVVVCSRLLSARINRPEDLSSEILLKSMIAPNSWDRWMESVGLEVTSQRVIPLANATLCLQAAAQNLGVAVTQEAYVLTDIANGALVQPLKHAVSSDEGYYLVFDPIKADSGQFRKFVEWIEQETTI